MAASTASSAPRSGLSKKPWNTQLPPAVERLLALLRLANTSLTTFRPNTATSRATAVRSQHWSVRCHAKATACERGSQPLRGTIRRLSGHMDRGLKQRQRDDEALATIASLVGALVLARAVNDRKLSNDILRTTKSRLDD